MPPGPVPPSAAAGLTVVGGAIEASGVWLAVMAEQTGPGGPESKDEIHRGSGVGDHLVKEGASPVDAMGKDKRREVVGHAYGPSRRSQVMFFVAVGVILVVIIGGWTLAVAAFDQPPDSNPDKAPWSAADAPQIPARDPAGPC